MVAPLPLDIRRQRLRIRGRQRGILELCVLFERFIDASPLDDIDEVAALEALLLESDRDIEMWLSNTSSRPPRHVLILSKITEILGLPY